MKIHLANSLEPLKLGTDLSALCQAIVSRAEAAFFFNERAEIDYVDILFDSRICWKCRKELRDKEFGKEIPDTPRDEVPQTSYLYGLMQGQEVLEQKRMLAEIPA